MEIFSTISEDENHGYCLGTGPINALMVEVWEGVAIIATSVCLYRSMLYLGSPARYRDTKRGFGMLYPDSGISMDEEIVLGDMIWSYNKAEL